MNVRTLCLSILHEREATGYEIRKLCTEGECSYFVEASFGSIYPALAKLEKEALVTSRVEHQDGKPSKKLYAITDAGRAEFINSLLDPIGPDVYRSPYLLFARFAHLLPASVVRARTQEHLDKLAKEIADLHQIKADLDDSECARHANDAWVLRYGLSCLEVAHDQLLEHMNDLIKTARPDGEAAQAAE